MFLASLALVPRSHGGDRLDGQGLQHLLVLISELLYVEAAFAGRVLAELCEQRLRVAEQLKPEQGCQQSKTMSYSIGTNLDLLNAFDRLRKFKNPFAKGLCVAELKQPG